MKKRIAKDLLDIQAVFLKHKTHLHGRVVSSLQSIVIIV